MFTPLDIENKQFRGSFFGYNRDDVEEFLSVVQSEFDKVYRDNIALKDKVNMLTDAIKEYKGRETALQDTIATAQSVAEEMKRTAQLNAENIVAQAENKAKEIVLNMQREMTELNAKHESLKQNYITYKTTIKGLIGAQLQVLDGAE